MADTDQFVRTVASITREDRGPQTHAYDAPGLSPIEFLQAVYRDPLLPMSIRIDAARGLLPFVEPRPASIPSWHVGCTIVIPPFEPRTPDHEAHEGDNGKSQSFSHSAEYNPQPPSGATGPSNMMTTSEPSPFIPDYSTLSPEEIHHLKAIALKWGLPEPHPCSFCANKLAQMEYHRRRKAILNGDDEDRQEELRT